MQAKPKYRDRPEEEVAVLDALVERAEEGMTVLDLRAAVETDIDTIETALSSLKEDGLIQVRQEGERTLICPADRVVPDPEDGHGDEPGLLDALREKFGL